MFSIEKNVSHSNGRRAPVLLMDWNIAGIAPPNVPPPVPESPPSTPPEIPDAREPLGAPAPTENPMPVREPPTTLPPQA